MKSLTAGLSGKMLSSSAKGGENVPARRFQDQDFEVEGEVGKVIFQSGEFGPNQINFYSTSTEHVLHRDHRIMICRGGASTSSPMMLSWASRSAGVPTGTPGEEGSRREHTVSARTALLFSASRTVVCFDSFHTYSLSISYDMPRAVPNVVM